jgi:uncharacterized membrane protein
MERLFGSALLVVGVYFFGQDIMFVGPRYGIEAGASVILLTVGIFTLLFWRSAALFGWIAVGLGILLVFVGSRAFLQPTSLWDFFVGLALMAAGYKIFKDGDINI